MLTRKENFLLMTFIVILIALCLLIPTAQGQRFDDRKFDNSASFESGQTLVFNNLLSVDVSGAKSGLPEEFRTGVILCDIEGLTSGEIACFVDCPLGTVRSRVHRGRNILHSKLYEYAKDRGYIKPERRSAKGLQLVWPK